MTDKQKQAILAINEAKQKDAFNDEQYYMLMEFIMGNQQTPQYIPWYVETPHPIAYPWVTYQTTTKADMKL